MIKELVKMQKQSLSQKQINTTESINTKFEKETHKDNQENYYWRKRLLNENIACKEENIKYENFKKMKLFFKKCDRLISPESPKKSQQIANFQEIKFDSNRNQIIQMNQEQLLVKRDKDIGFIKRACIRKKYENLFKLYEEETYIQDPISSMQKIMLEKEKSKEQKIISSNKMDILLHSVREQFYKYEQDSSRAQEIFLTSNNLANKHSHSNVGSISGYENCLLEKKQTLPFITQFKEGRRKRQDFYNFQNSKRSLQIISLNDNIS